MYNFQIIESFFEGIIEDKDLKIPTFEKIRLETALKLIHKSGLHHF